MKGVTENGHPAVFWQTDTDIFTGEVYEYGDESRWLSKPLGCGHHLAYCHSDYCPPLCPRLRCSQSPPLLDRCVPMSVTEDIPF